MENVKSEGMCKFCKNLFSGRAMSKHLQSCHERIKANELEEKQGKIFLIEASSDPFFVYFEVNASSTLKKVDQFLRDLWLECCGHLSAFTISNIRYFSHPESGDDEKSMDAMLKNILKPNLKFIHEYDFGTTTQLDLSCISEREGKLKKEIDIIARNNMPEFKCNKCGKPAKEICAECVYNGKGLLCESCAKTHECGEDMLLPCVNSPRTGMCGYTGKD